MILVIAIVAYSTRLVSDARITGVARRSCENNIISIGDPILLFPNAVRSQVIGYLLLQKKDHVSSAQPCSMSLEDSIHR